MPMRREHRDRPEGDEPERAEGPRTLDEVDDVPTLRGYVETLLSEREAVLGIFGAEDFSQVVEHVRALEQRIGELEAVPAVEPAELDELRERLRENEECEAVLEEALGTCDVDEILAIVGELRAKLADDPVDGSAVHALAVENDELRDELHGVAKERDALAAERRRLLEFAGCTSVDQLIVALDRVLHGPAPAAEPQPVAPPEPVAEPAPVSPVAEPAGPVPAPAPLSIAVGADDGEVIELRERLAAAEAERRSVIDLVDALNALLRRPSA